MKLDERQARKSPKQAVTPGHGRLPGDCRTAARRRLRAKLSECASNTCAGCCCAIVVHRAIDARGTTGQGDAGTGRTLAVQRGHRVQRPPVSEWHVHAVFMAPHVFHPHRAHGAIAPAAFHICAARVFVYSLNKGP